MLLDALTAYIDKALDNVFAPVDPALACDRQARQEAFNAYLAQQPDLCVVNGVALSQSILNQLWQHGFNPAWCTPYELRAAGQEALVDGTVFHDPYGNDFYDDLDLTEEEIEEDDDEIDPPPYRMSLHVRPDEEHEPDPKHNLPVLSFHEMEKKRRKEKLSNFGSSEGDGQSAVAHD